MTNCLRFMIRWFSYPVIFGGTAGWMIWMLYKGLPYWPGTALIAVVGIIPVAILECLQPFRKSWLAGHQDTLQFTAAIPARLGDWVNASAPNAVVRC